MCSRVVLLSISGRTISLHLCVLQFLSSRICQSLRNKGRTIKSPGRGVGSFFVQDFFLVGFGAARFFLANAGIFLSGHTFA